MKTTENKRHVVASAMSMNPAARIKEAVVEHGPAQGAQKLIREEFLAAKRAVELGVYGVWRPVRYAEASSSSSTTPPRVNTEPRQEFCARIGLQSRCFCGFTFAEHRDCQTEIAAAERSGKKAPLGRSDCSSGPCPRFRFIPKRPEEVGEWWLVRRRGFDVTTWRAKCQCGAAHTEHAPDLSESCPRGVRRTGKGGRYQSAWCCVTCDQPYEAHETVWETEAERKAAHLVVGTDFFPLSADKELQDLVLRGDATKSALPFRPKPERSVRLSGHAKRAVAVVADVDHGVSSMLENDKNFAINDDQAGPRPGTGGQQAARSNRRSALNDVVPPRALRPYVGERFVAEKSEQEKRNVGKGSSRRLGSEVGQEHVDYCHDNCHSLGPASRDFSNSTPLERRGYHPQKYAQETENNDYPSLEDFFPPKNRGSNKFSPALRRFIWNALAGPDLLLFCF
ncbi:unnamed protein product [Amoebophrya sp. A120]|nr:unnamed protein product [Amoebophrya sp. A120]|eukprot:GSA120T00017777001.1